MAALTPDDPIFRQPGYWIDNRGSEMPVVARYTVWWVAAVAFLPLFAAARIIGFGFLVGLVVAALAAAWVGMLVADRLNGEHTIRSWTMTLVAVARSRRRTRSLRRPTRMFRRTYR